MLRMNLLAVLLASTVALPTLAAADPSHDEDWRGPGRRSADVERSDHDAPRAYNEGLRDGLREAQRADRRRDGHSDGRRSRDYDRRSDDWRRGRDEVSPADIIIPLLLR